MKGVMDTLNERLNAALAAAFGDDGGSAAVRRSSHADYQTEVALGLARKLKKPPREVAETLRAALDLTGVAEQVEIAGPGFLNITLARAYLEQALAEAYGDERVGVAPAGQPETVAIDYSSPNVAKEMHVGHIRSTILGDALARTLELLGHRVVRQNHLGDWGTPFGMLIEHLRDTGAQGDGDLNACYREARAKFDADASFAERARRRVVALQSGDADTLAAWEGICRASRRQFVALYQRLGVSLTDDDVRGESFYNPHLAGVVQELVDKGLAVESGGALCVFVPGFTNREGEPLPLIVRKQDGGFGYAATDLAAVRYRVRDLGATRLLYVVGAPQRQHLTMVFEAARMAGWLDGARAEHVAFGSILGPDKKMFRTRAGETVRLGDLLDEAEQRSLALVREKSPELPESEQRAVARQVGLGAIKYADLASDRIKDYVFDWDRMIRADGDTGPYLMYAHARIRSILRKADDVEPGGIELVEPAERALALELLALGTAIHGVGETLQPHRLCAQLYAMATAFTGFYEKCPVLRGGDARGSRLRLCDLTARSLRLGLGLLGITAPERM